MFANNDPGKKSLAGRTLYIPRMSYCTTRTISAVFESIGVQARPSPDSDAQTLQLGGKYTSGDECLPQKVTLGNFLKVINSPDFDPKKTAFLMATANGPCRFGQYTPYLNKLLLELGLEDVMIISPNNAKGYNDLEDNANGIMRNAWRAIVASDILRKLLLITRPHELEKGTTDKVFLECLDQVCQVFAEQKVFNKQRLKNLAAVLRYTRDKFRKIPARYSKEKPLIGVVGEIFCRLNDFSNNFIIRKIEEYGGMVWLSDIAEWAWYTNEELKENLVNTGKRFSLQMLVYKLKIAYQHHEEHMLYELFKEDFRGVEEPDNVNQILNNSEPYLPQKGTSGEMVLNIGKSIYLHNKGVDAVAEISPFTCMNGIVCESIYPAVSRDHDNFPIRTFYFDGTQTDLDRDVGIFMEMARGYQRRKKKRRTYPPCFE